jgi:alkylhydroperoxidase/carboxymuconolactone decarboxylase family protein YurZ
VVMHMAIYGGFPVAVEGMAVAKEVFDATES